MKYAFFSLALALPFVHSCKETVPTKPDDKTQLAYDTTSHNITWFADTLGDYGQELKDIWAADSVNFYAVGSINISSDPNRIPRSIIKWNGTDWVDLPEVGYGQSQQLSNTGKSIFGFSNTDIWIAGVSRANGTVSLQGEGYPFSHFNGTNWTTITAPTPPWDIFGIRVNIYDMWGSDPNHLWAVGDSGLVYFWNGGIWTKQTVPQEIINAGMSLYSIFGFSASDVYACGSNLSDQSVLMHYDGVSWQIVEYSLSPSSSSPFYMNDVHGERWKVGEKTQEKLYLVAEYLYEWDRIKYPNERRWEKVTGIRNTQFGWGKVNGNGRGQTTLLGGRNLGYWNGITWKEYENIPRQFIGTLFWKECFQKGSTIITIGDFGSGFSRPVYSKGIIR